MYVLRQEGNAGCVLLCTSSSRLKVELLIEKVYQVWVMVRPKVACEIYLQYSRNIFSFATKQDKYTMDPGRQIYLSNNNNKKF